MNISRHGTANVIAVFPLSHFLGWDWKVMTIFLLAGIVIDIDHLFYFTIKHKTISPAKWFEIGKTMRERMQPGLYVLHSPEFNFILLVLSFFNGIIFVIFISNLIHIFLDIYEHYQYYKNFLWIKKWSMIYLSIYND